jgi:hypothetical protein
MGVEASELNLVVWNEESKCAFCSLAQKSNKANFRGGIAGAILTLNFRHDCGGSFLLFVSTLSSPCINMLMISATTILCVVVFLSLTLLSRGEELRCLGNDATTAKDLFNVDTLFARKHCYKCDWMHVKLTVIMLYHNECNSLRLLTHSWMLFPSQLKKQVRLLVIDDNSQIPACDCVEKYDSPSGDLLTLKDHGISVIRIDDNRKWNIGGARNMGAFFSCSEFLFVCDIDALISQSLLQSALLLTNNPTAKYQLHQFNRNFTQSTTKFHPGMMLLARDAYWTNHGCDEDFVGE